MLFPPPAALLPLFNYFEASWLGHYIRDSLWLFAAIESVHLLALAAMGGAVLVVDLRLAGFFLKSQPVSGVARDAQPWLIGALIVILTSGFLLLIDEPLRCYYSDAFWVKMTFLGLAIVFTFTVRLWVTRSGERRLAPVWLKLVGIVSILLWSGVGMGGRAIAFF
jgi:hypothetical protein